MAEASFSTLDWRSSICLTVDKNVTGLFPWFKQAEIAFSEASVSTIIVQGRFFTFFEKMLPEDYVPRRTVRYW